MVCEWMRGNSAEFSRLLQTGYLHPQAWIWENNQKVRGILEFIQGRLAML